MICNLPSDFDTEVTWNKILKRFTSKQRNAKLLNQFRFELEKKNLISTELRCFNRLLIKRNFD